MTGFHSYLDPVAMRNALPREAAPIEDAYNDAEGMLWRLNGGKGELIQEVVRLSGNAILLASDHTPKAALLQSETVDERDWVHIQIRLSGGGHETVSNEPTVPTPHNSCVIARYPRHSTVERELEKDNKWKFVCLLVRPEGLTNLLDVRASALPEHTAWIADDGENKYCSRIIPLRPAMITAANDILSCQFKGGIRRAYMRGKAIELFSIVIDALTPSESNSDHEGLKLSPADVRRIVAAREFMDSEKERPITLAALARRVGLNRTKLALGFKQIYGVPVLAYWRDVRLAWARERLRNPSISITDVAFAVGYTEPASFTRAFNRKFGFLPRDCRD